jgi:hypothetical protein
MMIDRKWSLPPQGTQSVEERLSVRGHPAWPYASAVWGPWAMDQTSLSPSSFIGGENNTVTIFFKELNILYIRCFTESLANNKCSVTMYSDMTSPGLSSLPAR